MNDQLISLDHKVDELIAFCQLLAQENLALKNREAHWANERANLLRNNELACAKIEAMIDRLKTLEKSL